MTEIKKQDVINDLNFILATDTLGSSIINRISKVKMYIEKIPQCPKCGSTYVEVYEKKVINYGKSPYTFFDCKNEFCGHEWEVKNVK